MVPSIETAFLNRFAAISAADPQRLSPSSCISRCRDINCIRFCTLSSVAEAAWCTSRSMKFLKSNISTAMSIHSAANTQKRIGKKRGEKNKNENPGIKTLNLAGDEGSKLTRNLHYLNLFNPKTNRQNPNPTDRIEHGHFKKSPEQPCLTTL